MHWCGNLVLERPAYGVGWHGRGRGRGRGAVADLLLPTPGLLLDRGRRRGLARDRWWLARGGRGLAGGWRRSVALVLPCNVKDLNVKCLRMAHGNARTGVDSVKDGYDSVISCLSKVGR